MSTLEERIDLMSAKMTLRSPFISAVFTTLPRLVAEKGSAGTNGEFFIFGREFCDPLTEEQLLGLGIHEASHVVLGHIWRSEGYDHGLANVAQDAVINRMIREMGFDLPKGGCEFPWVTADMDWEEVYRRLKDEAKDQPQNNSGGGSGGDDSNPMGLSKEQQPLDGKMQSREGSKGHGKFGQGGFDGKGDCDPCPTEANKTALEATILTAAKMARACGDTSALVDRVIGKLGQPTVSWLDELRAMLLSTSRDDYSFRRPSRRMLSQGYYLPSLYSEAIGGLAIGFDMSGSMSDDDANKIATELQGIVDDCNPDWVEVAYFDSTVGRVQRFERGDPLELKPNGGGGTRFVPVFKHFAKTAETERIAGMVFFTDMESSDLMQCEEPEYPVIWGVVNGDDKCQIPFGRTIRVAV